VIFPADRNGVVGIKATVGLVSRRGIIPELENLDTVGPFDRTVEDAATVLDVIVGKDRGYHPVIKHVFRDINNRGDQ
jgi:amidase